MENMFLMIFRDCASRLLFDPGCLLHDLLEYNASTLLHGLSGCSRFAVQRAQKDASATLNLHHLTFPSPSSPVILTCLSVRLPELPSHQLLKPPHPCLPINAAAPSTMLPCINWLQPFLALISSTLLTRGHNCPSSCLCPDHHTVDCTSKGLTRVPDSIPLDVRRLLLSNNWIPWIPSDFLVLYSDLVYLDLRNNSLSQLEPGTLSSSSRLVFLDLGSNNLTEIPSGTFGESRSLIKLRLGNNPYLSMVGRDAFTGLTSLRELELERNGLTELDVSILESLPSLRMLRLEGNPWFCNCHFAKLFVWLMENRHKLPKDNHNADTCTRGYDTTAKGMEGIECSLPLDGRRVPLSLLSEDSFRECRGTLTLTDYLIVIFSGISVSVAAIMASFFLASTVHCFQRLSKGSKGDEEEGND
uniref:Leucine rich repeat containing 38a n=1 Tax=Dicentrarchus labrax TaxID=13489 RepID=A0A8P4K2Z5_DICLA